MFETRAVETDLARYYDGEGDERANRPIDPRRVESRDRILALLGRSPRRVLEIGPGPGRDATAFLAAGHTYAGADLSAEHARRALAAGAPVVVAPARDLPFASASFDALWTMSTLMHVPDTAIAPTLVEIRRVLAPGAIAAVGVWGGPDVEQALVHDRRPELPARLFSRRSPERWRSMLESLGTVVEFDVWSDDQGGDFDYHWAVLER